MGNFYVNYTLRGAEPGDVAATLAGRVAIVTPTNKGCVVVFDEESDSQNTDVMLGVGKMLSSALRCTCLGVLNHDDDILMYHLHRNGDLVDEYNSLPGYFEPNPSPESLKPSGGDAGKLCEAFEAQNIEAVSAILHPEGERNTFAVEQHAALVEALGASEFAVGTAYMSFERDEFPDGLSPDDLIRT